MPQQQMNQLLTGHWVAQALFTVAKLGVPDVIGGRALAAGEIAEKVGANPAYLRRLLRALASVGVFAEDTRGRFKATPLSNTLRAAAQHSLRDFALVLLADYNYRSWERLHDAVKSGKTAFDLEHGQPIFDYLKAHPAEDRLFSAAMASISSTEIEGVARAYPFGRFEKLIDVGGAHGHVLAAILRRHRKLRGVLYDQPQVVAHAAASGFITAPEVRDRCEVVGGSFFDSVPRGADAYLMRGVVHDWEDDRCARILTLCRDALAPGGRVLVVEPVILPGNAPDWMKWMDINMLVAVGGQERTEAEFRALFEKAGLELVKIYPAGQSSILEAAPRGRQSRRDRPRRGARGRQARRASVRAALKS
ncbi:MAG TPA: methyltransferase [Myxococcota bacterium]|nr:methyltransferase [Myxococcota bacterium]